MSDELWSKVWPIYVSTRPSDSVSLSRLRQDDQPHTEPPSSRLSPRLPDLQEQQAPTTFPPRTSQLPLAGSRPSPLGQLTSQLPQPQAEIRQHLWSEDRDQPDCCHLRLRDVCQGLQRCQLLCPTDLPDEDDGKRDALQ